MMKRMNKAPPRCAYCEGRLGLLVSRHWDLRFCSRNHKELHLKQEQERRDNLKRWLGWLGYLANATPAKK
jgi:hypothetical protein